MKGEIQSMSKNSPKAITQGVASVAGEDLFSVSLQSTVLNNLDSRHEHSKGDVIGSTSEM